MQISRPSNATPASAAALLAAVVMTAMMVACEPAPVQETDAGLSATADAATDAGTASDDASELDADLDSGSASDSSVSPDAAPPPTEVQLTLEVDSELYMHDELLNLGVRLQPVSGDSAADLYVYIDHPQGTRYLTAEPGEPWSDQPRVLLTDLPTTTATYFTAYQGPASTFPVGEPFVLQAVLVLADDPPELAQHISNVATLALAVVGGAESAAEIAQMEHIDELRQEGGPAFRLEVRDRAVQHMAVGGSASALLGLQDETDPDVVALAFLERYAELLRVPDAARALRMTRRETGETDELYFRQYVGDIPVFGSWLQLVLTPGAQDVRIDELSARYVPEPEVAALPDGATPDQARSAVAEHYGITPPELKLMVPSRLWVFDPALFAPSCPSCEAVPHAPRLVWRVIHFVPGDGVVADAFVDVRDLTLLHLRPRALDREYRIRNARHEGPRSCFVGNTTVYPWFDEAGVCHYEVGCPALSDCCNNICEWARWRCANPNEEGHGAFAATNYVYNFLRDVYSRDSYNDRDYIMRLYLRAGTDWVNASSRDCGAYQVHVFGEDMATLDVIAHEVGHSWHHSEVDFVYAEQSGAIAEHVADAFGHFVGSWSGEDPDWTIGEDSVAGGRRMDDPPADNYDTGDPYPDHMRDYLDTGSGEAADFGGVHRNHMILSKALFLYTDGGTFEDVVVSPIGEEKARQILKRVVNSGLGENPWFHDFARVTGRKCRDLAASSSYGLTDDDCCQVGNAFAAVGLGDLDTDCDGVIDTEDPDSDDDGVPDLEDNCPLVQNPGQENMDTDRPGDACDTDIDGDLIDNEADNCPRTRNAGQEDLNGDGEGDACDNSDTDRVLDDRDNCPYDYNPDQLNSDFDDDGDECDDDDDDDGYLDGDDNCPKRRNFDQLDADGDGVGDGCDNCDDVDNPFQENVDGDAYGDACDPDIDDDGVLNENDDCPEEYTYVSEWLICPPQTICSWGCPPSAVITDVSMRFRGGDFENMDPSVLRPFGTFRVDPCELIACDPEGLGPRGESIAVDMTVSLPVAQGVQMEEPIPVMVAIMDESGREVGAGQVDFMMDGSGVPAAQEVKVVFSPSPTFGWGQPGANDPTPMAAVPTLYMTVASEARDPLNMTLLSDVGLHIGSEGRLGTPP